MRWKEKQEESTRGGDRRSRLVFAWKKTRVERHIVWLERYWVHERFFQPAGGGPGWWQETGKSTADYYL